MVIEKLKEIDGIKVVPTIYIKNLHVATIWQSTLQKNSFKNMVNILGRQYTKVKNH